ncbi:hypothetical protein H257_19128 [Aphanomyces astaci]|uniref:DDE Tnp4 domain-containing protein n=1 Tax=Aphanomyces astaci TaxID=112090 RepID=W4F905_APHAT|nr:hypothetical protein H257_19128 [Aphanomyces astaci]ETV63937.1 hypothetical protein H257_19128 [Aphanomyces astaci]|eukprot:XP_009846578.1 hypothetical protein H257_19128 [Aphanomyces astaci]
MALLTTSCHQIANFPFVRYGTDVTFQQTNTLSGSYAEKKTYFEDYGHKVEVSVLPNGFAIHSTAHYKGSVSDKAIFDDNSFTCLPYQATEDRIADHGDEGTNQWAVIADKVYQGIQRVVRVVLPKKKPAGGILTLEDIRSNDRIASDV